MLARGRRASHQSEHGGLPKRAAEDFGRQLGVGRRLTPVLDIESIERVAKAFTGELRPAPRGGHYVVVPLDVADAAGLRHGMRVRGTLNGTAYRSSLMKYGGIFHLGVHKAKLAAAGIAPAAAVSVTIEVDAQPLPTDVVPRDLARALKRQDGAAAAWDSLRPSLKREHVQSLLSAKKAETRERRLEKILESLLSAKAPAKKRGRS